MPMFQQTCATVEFGTVSAGGPPCDLTVELRNNRRNGQATGPLNITKIELLVVELEALLTTDGTQVGFSFRDETGAPLSIDTAHPLSVPIPAGQNIGTQRFRIRYDGSVKCPATAPGCSGVWHGEADHMTGLRIYSDDPDHQPYEVFAVDATAM
jgi:hypothetical protein